MSAAMLTEPEQEVLLRWAREVLEGLLHEGETPALEGRRFPPALVQPAGAFVTLHLCGELRGCIGTFSADRPLVEIVREMAVAAATQDPRFRPVPRGELPLIQLEISVLSPRWPSRDPLAELEIGVHGIYLTRGWHRGVLLPQVASEQGWDAETFLAHTCRKAGLDDEQAWRAPDTRIELFTAQVFGEPARPDPAEGGAV